MLDCVNLNPNNSCSRKVAVPIVRLLRQYSEESHVPEKYRLQRPVSSSYS